MENPIAKGKLDVVDSNLEPCYAQKMGAQNLISVCSVLSADKNGPHLSTNKHDCNVKDVTNSVSGPGTRVSYAGVITKGSQSLSNRTDMGLSVIPHSHKSGVPRIGLVPVEKVLRDGIIALLVIPL